MNYFYAFRVKLHLNIALKCLLSWLYHTNHSSLNDKLTLCISIFTEFKVTENRVDDHQFAMSARAWHFKYMFARAQLTHI